MEDTVPCGTQWPYYNLPRLAEPRSLRQVVVRSLFPNTVSSTLFHAVNLTICVNYNKVYLILVLKVVLGYIIPCTSLYRIEGGFAHHISKTRLIIREQRINLKFCHDSNDGGALYTLGSYVLVWLAYSALDDLAEFHSTQLWNHSMSALGPLELSKKAANHPSPTLPASETWGSCTFCTSTCTM